jgi:spore maturation protein CgeB
MDKLGLVDGQTCIIWRDFKELEQKIRYYLARDAEADRRRIAEAGEKLALEQHSFDVRVQELFHLLQLECYMR